MGGSNGKNSIHIYYCRNAADGTPAAFSKPREGVLMEAVPCTGRIDTRYLLKAFESGARAVLILGCPSGHCKSMEGNLRAVARVGTVNELLAESGLAPDSVKVFMPSGPGETALNAAIESISKAVDEVKA